MNKAVKVLSLVSYKFLPPNMGGQKNIALFNRFLAKNVNLSCIGVKDNEPGSGVEYSLYNILGNSKFRYINFLYFFTLKRFINKHNITQLIIEHPYYGWLGLLLKWFCKIKLIVHSHNIESIRFKSTGKWWWGILWHYEKIVHKNADYSFFIQNEDKEYAIKNYKINPQKCTIITYGLEFEQSPSAKEKNAAKEQICKTHNIPISEKILLFNGTLGYKPNLDALDAILEKINPILLAEQGFAYKIIICGNKLPAAYNGLTAYGDKNILYPGFVDDISLYFKGADLFINPVIIGGGIKTKLVEALAYNLSVVSTNSGAIGISSNLSGHKMQLVADGDWEGFAKQVMSIKADTQIPGEFFREFYWGNIAEKAALQLNNL